MNIGTQIFGSVENPELEKIRLENNSLIDEYNRLMSRANNTDDESIRERYLGDADRVNDKIVALRKKYEAM